MHASFLFQALQLETGEFVLLNASERKQWVTNAIVYLTDLLVLLKCPSREPTFP